MTTVSHDLRTPLTSAQGYLELLPQVGPLNEKQEWFVARVQESLGDIADLVTELLDVRRVESELDLEMEPCNVAAIVDDVIRRLSHQAEERGQELIWNEPEGLPGVRGSSQRLRQVVDNLVKKKRHQVYSRRRPDRRHCQSGRRVYRGTGLGQRPRDPRRGEVKGL